MTKDEWMHGKNEKRKEKEAERKGKGERRHGGGVRKGEMKSQMSSPGWEIK